MRRAPALAQALTFALVVVAVACGGERPATRAASDAAAPAAALARESTVFASHDSAAPAPMPALLDAACIQGDPRIGEAFALRRAGAPSGAPAGAPAAAVTPLAPRALATLATRDSARLVARVARAADVLPSDTSVADFRGLPMTVAEAWLVVPAPDDTVVVAFAARRLPIESSPLEEAFAFVAAPGQRQGVRDALLVAWWVREVGREESLTPRELAGVIRREDGGLALLLVREREGARAALGAELLTRTAKTWTLAWAGALPRCP